MNGRRLRTIDLWLVDFGGFGVGFLSASGWGVGFGSGFREDFLSDFGVGFKIGVGVALEWALEWASILE